ncbi:NADH dehydrogenase [ubiquinone] 1 beta subcomplex subunit 9-like [Cydia amplana]|uniref:NADH dehydrogenase [ubiquinone] 1 beta subcomplex subunit 9-like n=1 Tax=Cydia amplana TaxID=1869771 RepID=UPI002FE593D9
MPFAPELRTHSQKVKTLYKTAMRLLESYHVAKFVTRYHQVILRAEFDKNRAVCDPKEQRRLLWVGQHEVFQKKNPLPPARFPYSLGLAGGVAYGREIDPPDWVLDYWHPLEKAQYPEYFNRRECRKQEYIKLWEKGLIR